MPYLKGMNHRLAILRHPLRHFLQKRRMHALERNWDESMHARDRLYVLRTLSRYQASHGLDTKPSPLPTRAEHPPIPPEAWEALYKPRHHLNPEPTVDIVMPVTDSYHAVIPTLYRLLSAVNETPMRVVLLVSDHPDHKLIAKLRRLQELDLFDLLQDSGGEGLVHLANFALQRHDQRDAVLLTSNLELPDYWLDRLRSTALTPYGSIATASPWVTLGGITGYPDETGSLATTLGDTMLLDAMCHSLFDDGITHTIPAPSLFLTYIPRNSFTTIGPFPEQASDLPKALEQWSATALEKGFEHFFAPRVLAGAFTAPKPTKHSAPTAFDPESPHSDIASSRLLIDHTRLRAGAVQPTLIIDGLPTSHSFNHHDAGALHLSPDPLDPTQLRLGLPDARLFPHLSFAIDDPAQPLILLLESLGITRVILRQLAGFPSRMLEYTILIADRLGANYRVELTDDHLVCPGLLGIDKTCAPEDLESGYTSFLSTHPLDADGHPLWLWRLRASMLFAKAETVTFASEDLKTLYQRYYHVN